MTHELLLIKKPFPRKKKKHTKAATCNMTPNIILYNKGLQNMLQKSNVIIVQVLIISINTMYIIHIRINQKKKRGDKTKATTQRRVLVFLQIKAHWISKK